MKNPDKSNSITLEMMRNALTQILSSLKFRNSQVLSVFLQFVVDETLAGRLNEIKEYTIGVRALGRAVTFNPQSDAVVRIHAGRLRRILTEYYESEGLNDPILIEIPKGSYIPVFKHRSDETTLEKIQADDPAAASDYKPTLAVFPFHNYSADNSMDYFVEGIGDQLSIDLARFEHISVISYYSTVGSNAGDKNAKENLQNFNINYTVTGSARFSDSLIQINVQLMLAKTETLLWTQSYLRHFTPDNLYNIQDEIIEQVVSKIADNDGIIIRHITQSPDFKKKELYSVYEAIYLYYSFRGKHSPEIFQQALTALEHATDLDPNNALVWALLGKLFLNNYIFNKGQSAEDLEKSKIYTEKSMWLDQNCQSANKVQSWLYLLTGRKNDCSEAIERCLGLNAKAPSITGSMGFLLICVGKYTQGFNLLLKTMYLNPVMPWYCNLGFALYYYNNEEYEDAFHWTQNTGDPDMPLLSVIRSAAMTKMKEENNEKIDDAFQQDVQMTETAIFLIERFIYDDTLKAKLLLAFPAS